MSRLIDADKLIKELHEVLDGSGYDEDYKDMGIDDFIMNQPTAFDAEKLISGLEEEKDIAYADFDKYANDYELDLDSDYDDLFHRGLARAIDVIRKGGVE